MKRFKNIIVNGAENIPMAMDVFYKEQKPQPVVIYAHGFNGFKDWGAFDLIAGQFAEAGFCFIKFNFSHSGTTPENPEVFTDMEAYGNNNYTKELEDLQTIVEWSLSNNNPHRNSIDRSKIFLLGHSRGGGIVLLKAAEEKRIRAVATWASVAQCKTPWGSWPEEKIRQWKIAGVEYYTNSRTKQQLPLYYQLYEDYEKNKERLDIMAAVKRLSIPILICHGTIDEAVPVSSAYALHHANDRSELFLLEADHVFGRKHPWTQDELPAAMQSVVTKTIEFFKAN